MRASSLKAGAHAAQADAQAAVETEDFSFFERLEGEQKHPPFPAPLGRTGSDERSSSVSTPSADEIKESDLVSSNELSTWCQIVGQFQ